MQNNRIKTYICGHKSPDTDCTVAAICYQPIYQYEHPNEEVISIVAGQISYQTKNVLLNAHMQEPPQLNDIFQRASDIIPQRQYIRLTANHPLASTAFYSNDIQYDFIIVDQNDQYLGILKAEQLIQLYAAQNEEKDITQVICTPYSMIESVFGKLVYIPEENLDIFRELKLKVAVCSESLESLIQITKDWNQQEWIQL